MAADPAKVLRIVFPTAETGFDPARVSDLYSATVNEAIFERLLTYDYLARPAKLVPMVAEAMPEVTENGRVYTYRIRKGIHFTPDPAFKGAKRELVAQDFIYSFMRFMDPKNRSPYAFLVEGKIEGLDALAEKAKETGKFDYDAKIPGMVAVDRYTLRFRLVQNDYNFPYVTAMVPSWVVAREVIEAYGDDTLAHPVGTGPYMLKSWTRGSKIVLEANPDYRGFVWDFAPGADPWDQTLVAAMKGKRMPQIGRVEISIIEEDQSRWLAFNQKEIDHLNLPATFRTEVFEADRELKPEWTEKGVTVFRAIDPDITYTYFNFRDPLVGGFAKEKIALRRAIIMAYNLDEEIRVLRKHQAVAAEMPIPAGVVGHDPSYRSINRYDPALANKLLDYFKYARGKDGYRTLPDGKPLVLRYASGTTAIEREFNELWKKSMDAIGLRIEFDVTKFADRLQGGEGLPADDVGLCVERRLSGRRQLHAAALRPQHRPEQQRLLRVQGVRRVLREVDADARFAGAQPAVPRDDAADGSRRRVEPARVARAQPDDLAVGAGLQEAPDPAGRVRLPGPRAAPLTRAVIRRDRPDANAAPSRLGACRRAGRYGRGPLRRRPPRRRT